MRAISCLATSLKRSFFLTTNFTAIEIGRFSVSARLLLSNELLWTTTGSTFLRVRDRNGRGLRDVERGNRGYPCVSGCSSRRKRQRENERVQIGETQLLAAHFSTEQSQRCAVQRRNASRRELGLAKGHLFPASLASNQNSSVRRRLQSQLALSLCRIVRHSFHGYSRSTGAAVQMVVASLFLHPSMIPA